MRLCINKRAGPQTAHRGHNSQAQAPTPPTSTHLHRRHSNGLRAACPSSLPRLSRRQPDLIITGVAAGLVPLEAVAFGFRFPCLRPDKGMGVREGSRMVKHSASSLPQQV